VPELATEEELRIALEKAFDYRGDVMLTLKNNSRIEGYIFDRVSGCNAGHELCARPSQRFRPEGENRLCRYCGNCLLRERHGCREELGGMGSQILGKEGIREADLSLEPESLE